MAEETTVFALGKAATEHFHDVLNGLEGMEHTRQVGFGGPKGELTVWEAAQDGED